MSKSLFLLGLGAILCSAPLSAAPNKVSDKVPSNLEEARRYVKKVNARNAENQEVWRPATKTFLYWDGYAANAWIEQYSYACTYSPEGLLLEEECADQGFKNSYEYDEEGRLVKQVTYYFEEGKGEYVEDAVQIFEYDPVVKDLVVLFMNDSAWGSYGYGMEIVRNELGNIVSVKGTTIMGAEPTYNGQELVVEYGDDNKANKIIERYNVFAYDENWQPVYDENGNPVIEETMETAVLSDIVWENTDGQIYEINLGEINTYAEGGFKPNTDNRIKSCMVKNQSLPFEVSFSADYDGLNYHNIMQFGEGERVTEITFDSIDENGSFNATKYNSDYELNMAGNYYLEASLNETYTYIVDQFGNVLDNSTYSMYFDKNGQIEDEYNSSSRGEVEYDPEYGYPLAYTELYLYYGDEDYTPQSRVEYSNYSNVAQGSGILSIENASENAPVEFFNLNGMRVINPTDGIFIRRQGNKTSKVVIK